MPCFGAAGCDGKALGETLAFLPLVQQSMDSVDTGRAQASLWCVIMRCGLFSSSLHLQQKGPLGIHVLPFLCLIRNSGLTLPTSLSSCCVHLAPITERNDLLKLKQQEFLYAYETFPSTVS